MRLHSYSLLRFTARLTDAHLHRLHQCRLLRSIEQERRRRTIRFFRRRRRPWQPARKQVFRISALRRVGRARRKSGLYQVLPELVRLQSRPGSKFGVLTMIFDAATTARSPTTPPAALASSRASTSPAVKRIAHTRLLSLLVDTIGDHSYGDGNGIVGASGRRFASEIFVASHLRSLTCQADTYRPLRARHAILKLRMVDGEPSKGVVSGLRSTAQSRSEMSKSWPRPTS